MEKLINKKRAYKQRSLKKNCKCRICKISKTRSELRLRDNGSIKDSICKSCKLKEFKKYPHGKKYHKYRKTVCEICGFKGHFCQMDIDHIDNNHKNNNPINLRTLCSNCHRLETFRKKRL